MKIPSSEIFMGLDYMADGVFIVDGNLRIHLWNKAAEEILGFRQGDVEGQLCYKLFQGANEEGEPICCRHCQVSTLAMRSKPIPSYDTRMCTHRGDFCWLNMSIIALRLEKNWNDVMIVHMFRDISQKKADEMIFNQILAKARRYQDNGGKKKDDQVPDNQLEKLTRRQHEVLTLLGRGFSTRKIADDLSISQYTVRNHIQVIFQKFQVHNRLEAVTFALKNGLLENFDKDVL